MSNVYIQEPATHGKVILNTNFGDIEVELWSKETPKACRNFVQLCMEKYYDGTIFHRVIKGFIAQGGDPTGTGFGGESIYGEPFKDEFHSRLRFVRRGLIAMANSEKDANGSQFFFTLGPAHELQNKNTIFGKVVGKTQFNMLKLDEVETDKNDRPLNPRKIISTEIILNPFPDITPRVKEKPPETRKSEKPAKVKGKKDFKLLSFGDEAEEEEEELNAVSKEFSNKSKSLHDVVKDDPKISSIPAVDPSIALINRKRSKRQQVSDNERLDDDCGEKAPDKERSKLSKSRICDDAKQTYPNKDASDVEEEVEVDPEQKKLNDIRKEFLKLQRELKKSKRKKVEPEEQLKEDKSDNSKVNEFLTSRRQFKLKSQFEKNKELREAKTLELFEKFKNKISAIKEMVPTESEDKPESSAPTNNPLLLVAHRFTCQKEEETVLAKDANLRNEEDWFDIYDPRNPINKRRREAGGESEIPKKRSTR